MPGCILHVAGPEFSPESFLANSQFRPYKIFHRGEPLAKTGRLASKVFESSGFRCDVSEIYGDLTGQVKDAIRFLSQHSADFERLASDDAVTDCRLDFGYVCRLNDEICRQGEYLPVEFLALTGKLKVAVALSLYPSSQSPSQSP